MNNGIYKLMAETSNKAFAATDPQTRKLYVLFYLSLRKLLPANTAKNIPLAVLPYPDVKAELIEALGSKNRVMVIADNAEMLEESNASED